MCYNFCSTHTLHFEGFISWGAPLPLLYLQPPLSHPCLPRNSVLSLVTAWPTPAACTLLPSCPIVREGWGNPCTRIRGPLNPHDLWLSSPLLTLSDIHMAKEPAGEGQDALSFPCQTQNSVVRAHSYMHSHAQTLNGGKSVSIGEWKMENTSTQYQDNIKKTPKGLCFRKANG